MGTSAHLEAFSLVCANAGNETGIALARALHGNSALRFLHLDGLCFDEKTLIEMARMLLVNTHLTLLSLSNPSLQVGGVETKAALAQSLCTNATLRSLQLTCECFADDFVFALGESLRYNIGLTSLRLVGEGLG